MSEGKRGERVRRVTYRHTNGEEEPDAVRQHDQADPNRPAGECVAMQVMRFAEDADEDDLRRRVVVQRSSDDEVREKECKCRFCPFDREG